MRIGRRHIRIGILGRILLLNGLIVFLPVAALLLLDTYEEQLLDSLERSLVQQGRMLAAALSLEEELNTDIAQNLVAALQGRHEARIRVLNETGALLADSSVIDLVPAPDEPAVELPEGPRESFLYRVAVYPVRAARNLMGDPQPALPSADFYTTSEYANGREVQAALEGRYGAATRVSAGGQISVTLYSALPIERESGVAGVVLVSQSTFRILQDLYQVRIDVFQVFLWCLVAALVISAFLAITIARPIRVLETRAREAVDERGRLRGRLPTERRGDEIGALSHSLSELTGQVHGYTQKIEGFAADASHELKNPLASIAASCEIAATTTDPDRRDQMLHRARIDVKRAESILGGMRELSHIDAGTGTSGVAPIVDAVQAAVTELARVHTEVDIRMAVDEVDTSVLVGLPAERVFQIISNLVENAATIAPAESALVVRVAQCADLPRTSVCVSITDEGPGIEEPERVFDRFYTARPERGDHLGLGLSVVKAIVEAAGGSVAAHNRSPEPGAEFQIVLPIQN